MSQPCLAQQCLSVLTCRRFRKSGLPGGESNPGLPRDRRGYSPLYYRGVMEYGEDLKKNFDGTQCRQLITYLVSFKIHPTFATAPR